MEQEEAIDLKIPQRIEIGWKEALGVLIFIGSMGITGFWLVSDRHNDSRYVSTAKYEEDERRHQEQMKKLEERLNEIKTGQDKIIEHLLRKNSK